MNTLIIIQSNDPFPICNCNHSFDAVRKLALEYQKTWLDAGFSLSPATGSYVKGGEWRRAVLVDSTGLSWSLVG